MSGEAKMITTKQLYWVTEDEIHYLELIGEANQEEKCCESCAKAGFPSEGKVYRVSGNYYDHKREAWIPQSSQYDTCQSCLEDVGEITDELPEELPS